MSRSKKIYILLGVLVAACLITFGASRYEQYKEKIKNSEEIILELDTESVTAISWEYDSQTLSFHKDETWLYDEDEAFPVDEDKINELLDLFSEFGVDFTIEEVEDYGQYGLDDPLCTITIETEDETYEILLGDYSTMDEERYVSVGDGNAYLVVTDPLDYFDVELSDMILNDEIPYLASADAIQFDGAESYSIVYEEESSSTYCADDVYFVEESGEYLPLDTTAVESYLSTISALSLSDYVTYNVSDEELASYGLDNPELTINVEYTAVDDETEEETTGTLTLSISRDPEEIEAEESAEEDEETEEEFTAYLRVGESQIIYSITQTEYEALMEASYDALRHQEVFSGDFADVYQVDIELEDVSYTLTAETEDDETAWYYLGATLEIDDFSSALAALTADSFTDEQPLEKEEISLTLYLDNENYPTVSIQLYRYDGTYCLAVVDGEPVSLVERSEVVDLIETVNAIVLN